MTEDQHHSRRDFLQGKAAAKTFADRIYDLAQEWVGSATDLITDRFPASPTLHVEATRRAMACEFAIRYHEADRHMASDVLDAFDLIEAIEDRLTIYRPTSPVVELNQHASGGAVSVDPTVIKLLNLASKLHNETGGAFDISATPLSRVWGFYKREGQMPEEEEIAAALRTIDMSSIMVDPDHNTVHFQREGMEINFNAIGKGYALDEAAQLLAEQGGDDFLWHGGRSSVLARGINRADDRDCWTIGLRDPLNPQKYLAEFHLRNSALGTSGGATQFFEHEGRLYSHIIDPRTGWPAQGVFTATVLAPTAAEADALSTAAFVLGPAQLAMFGKRRPDIGIVLVCPSDNEFGITVHVSNMTKADWTPLCDARMIAVA